LNKSLTGVKEITRYAKRSWMTVKIWIKEDDFPARKIDGVWESMTDMVDEWKAKKIQGQK
jgi:hypothetical protein